MNASMAWHFGLTLGLVSVSLLGCGPGSSGTVAVTGKVTKGGQAVSDALITFVPSAADGKAASGTTDASGQYKLTTLVNGDGAMPGSYKVTITKYSGGPTAASSTPMDLDAAYKAAEAQGQNTGRDAAAPVSTNAIAAKYGTPDTSGLTADVKTGETKPIDFEITD